MVVRRNGMVLDGPAGIIPKNRLYLKSALIPSANNVMNSRLCPMTIGIAGTVMLVPYPEMTRSTLSTSSSLVYSAGIPDGVL